MITTDPRPAWTTSNVELFIFWMKTGSSTPPADQADTNETEEEAR